MFVYFRLNFFSALFLFCSYKIIDCHCQQLTPEIQLTNILTITKINGAIQKLNQYNSNRSITSIFFVFVLFRFMFALWHGDNECKTNSRIFIKRELVFVFFFCFHFNIRKQFLVLVLNFCFFTMLEQ